MNSGKNKDIDILSALHEVGLREEEARVYKTVLSLGSRPASIIAQKSGYKRAHTYNILGSLIQRGIVQEFVKNSVKHFSCSPPANLLSMVDQKEEEVRRQRESLLQMIPQLERLQNPASSRSHVRLFQGVEGIKQIYEDMLQYPGENIYGLVDISYSMMFARGENYQWIERFIHRRHELGIWWLGIMNHSLGSELALRSRTWLSRRVKLISGLDLSAEINIYGPRVAIMSTHTEALGFVIENEAIANTLRSIHQTVWEILPEYEAPEATQSSDTGLGGKRVVGGK